MHTDTILRIKKTSQNCSHVQLISKLRRISKINLQITQNKVKQVIIIDIQTMPKSSKEKDNR